MAMPFQLAASNSITPGGIRTLSPVGSKTRSKRPRPSWAGSSLPVGGLAAVSSRSGAACPARGLGREDSSWVSPPSERLRSVNLVATKHGRFELLRPEDVLCSFVLGYLKAEFDAPTSRTPGQACRGLAHHNGGEQRATLLKRGEDTSSSIL